MAKLKSNGGGKDGAVKAKERQDAEAGVVALRRGSRKRNPVQLHKCILCAATEEAQAAQGMPIEAHPGVTVAGQFAHLEGVHKLSAEKIKRFNGPASYFNAALDEEGKRRLVNSAKPDVLANKLFARLPSFPAKAPLPGFSKVA